MRKPNYPAYLQNVCALYGDLIPKIYNPKNLIFEMHNIYFHYEDDVDFEVRIYIDDEFIGTLMSEDLGIEIYDLLREKAVTELWKSE